MSRLVTAADKAVSAVYVIRFALDGSAVLLDPATWEVIGRWRGKGDGYPASGFYPAGGAA